MYKLHMYYKQNHIFLNHLKNQVSKELTTKATTLTKFGLPVDTKLCKNNRNVIAIGEQQQLTIKTYNIILNPNVRKTAGITPN